MACNSNDSLPAGIAVTALLAALPLDAALGQELQIYVEVTGRTVENVVSAALSSYLAAERIRQVEQMFGLGPGEDDVRRHVDLAGDRLRQVRRTFGLPVGEDTAGKGGGE